MSKIALFVPREEMVGQAQRVAQRMHMPLQEIRHVTNEQAVPAALEAIERGVEIFIARGTQAYFIRKATNRTVVEIVLTGQEIGLLINRAKAILPVKVPVIAFVGMRNMFSDMSYFDEIMGVKLRKYFVSESTELVRETQRAIADGVDLIVGGDTAQVCAGQAGVPFLFLSSTEDSIQETFRVAKQVAYASNLEKQNTAQFQTLLDYSFNGIIQLGAQGTVQVMNHVALEVLGQSAEGRHIAEFLEKDSRAVILEALESRQELYSSLITLSGTDVMANLAGITVDGENLGAILSFHPVKKLEEAKTDVRREYLLHRRAAGNFHNLVCHSPAMKGAVKTARQYAQSAAPVLLRAPTGTPEDLFAQSIHNNSACASGPFVPVDLGSWTGPQQTQAFLGEDGTSGLFAKANGGTLFLKNIQKLSLPCQHLLRSAIAEKMVGFAGKKPLPVTTRIIASCQDGRLLAMGSNAFLPELWYLLSALVLELPTLAQRPEDFDFLLDHALKQASDEFSKYIALTKTARERLRQFQWEGDLVQLEAFCHRLVLSAPSRTISEGFVASLLGELYPILYKNKTTNHVVEYRDPQAVALAELLDRHHGNRMQVAQELGISKTTLWRRMKRYGITGKDSF